MGTLFFIFVAVDFAAGFSGRFVFVVAAAAVPAVSEGVVDRDLTDFIAFPPGIDPVGVTDFDFIAFRCCNLRRARCFRVRLIFSTVFNVLWSPSDGEGIRSLIRFMTTRCCFVFVLGMRCDVPLGLRIGLIFDLELPVPPSPESPLTVDFRIDAIDLEDLDIEVIPDEDAIEVLLAVDDDNPLVIALEGLVLGIKLLFLLRRTGCLNADGLIAGFLIIELIDNDPEEDVNADFDEFVFIFRWIRDLIILLRSNPLLRVVPDSIFVSFCFLILLKNPRFLAAARGFGFGGFVDTVVVVAGADVALDPLSLEISFIVINGIVDPDVDPDDAPDIVPDFEPVVDGFGPLSPLFFPLPVDLIFLFFLCYDFTQEFSIKNYGKKNTKNGVQQERDW